MARKVGDAGKTFLLPLLDNDTHECCNCSAEYASWLAATLDVAMVGEMGLQDVEKKKTRLVADPEAALEYEILEEASCYFFEFGR
jgi:hypothetical protein